MSSCCPRQHNAGRLADALRDFGFGDCGVPSDAFAREGTVVALGVQPNQIYLLTSMSSQPTDEVLCQSQPTRLGNLPIRILAREDFILAKRESARPKDLADLAELGALAP